MAKSPAVASKESIKNNHILWVDRHASFCDTELYKNYHESLRLEREDILMVGKRTRDPHILSKLEGFDQAASFFQRCADATRVSQEDTNEENGDHV